MKTKPVLIAALAALLMIPNSLPVHAANADRLPEATAPAPDNTILPGSSPQDDTLIPDGTSQDNDILPDGTLQDNTILPDSTLQDNDILPDGTLQDNTILPDGTSSASFSNSSQDAASADTEASCIKAPEEAPAFSAHIEFSPQGYVTVGTFTEFLPGTTLVQPMYSLDGEIWQTCKMTWDLKWLGSENTDELKTLQNQTCLHASYEPLADYLAEQLDRFYLKLQITLENGLTYETQAAVIDRGEPQPLPEELTPVADFAPAIRIRQWRPFKSQAQYQITVSANAAPEDISALLPDTLPIQVYLYDGINFVTDTIVDCPVNWNPPVLPDLTPGESVTLEDAAEEIIVPAGTLLNTPNGIFQLKEPLYIEHDEVRLILNIVGENTEPAGALHGYFAGLELSFDLKPTGAAAIRAYTLLDGQSAWVEMPSPLLPEEVNAPSLTASSLFTMVLTKDQEPYHSWLAAWNAGDEPTPFLVGLKIEGGVYDGRQLILAWPDTYEIPTQPPALVGSGGNENNAGSDNKGDSTSEGQRPGLPSDPVPTLNPDGIPNEQTPTPCPDDIPNEQTPTPCPDGIPTGQTPTPCPDGMPNEQTPEPSHGSNDKQDTQEPAPTPNPGGIPTGQAPEPPHGSNDTQDPQEPTPTPNPDGMPTGQAPEPSHGSNDTQDTQEPTPTPNPGGIPTGQAPEPSHGSNDTQDTQEPTPTPNPGGIPTGQAPGPSHDSNGQEAIPPNNPSRQWAEQEPLPSDAPNGQRTEQEPLPPDTPSGLLTEQEPLPSDNLDALLNHGDSALPQQPQTHMEKTDRSTAINTPNAEASSPVAEENNHDIAHFFRNPLFPKAAAVSICTCIIFAAGKITGYRTSGKIIQALHRLLHMKK